VPGCAALEGGLLVALVAGEVLLFEPPHPAKNRTTNRKQSINADDSSERLRGTRLDIVLLRGEMRERLPAWMEQPLAVFTSGAMKHT
jgi:hypothetical protein